LEKLRYLKAVSKPNLPGIMVEAFNTPYNSSMCLTGIVRCLAQGKRTAGGVRQSHMHPTDFLYCEAYFCYFWASFPLRQRLCWPQAVVLEVLESVAILSAFSSTHLTLLSLALKKIVPLLPKHVDETCRWLHSCSSKWEKEPQMSLCWHCPKLWKLSQHWKSACSDKQRSG